MKKDAMYGIIKIALAAIHAKNEVTALTIQRDGLSSKLQELNFENDLLKRQIADLSKTKN